jgi:hypothetical protein
MSVQSMRTKGEDQADAIRLPPDEDAGWQGGRQSL